MFPALLPSATLLALSFAAGFLIRQHTGNGKSFWADPASPPAALPADAATGVGNPDSPLPWKQGASLRKIWERVDPKQQGDPTLIVRAVKDGLLEGTDGDIELFSNMLWLALDLDPDGITDYILHALAEGKFSEAQRDLLNKKPPLPMITTPAFSRLAAGYVKAFASTWGSGLRGIPYTYKRIRYFSPEVRTRTMTAPRFWKPNRHSRPC